MGKRVVLAFLLFVFFVPLQVIAEEHSSEKKEEKKEETKSGGDHDNKGKKEEKPAKPDKAEEQELLLNPKRFRIKDLSISRFGIEKVHSLVTYNFAITMKTTDFSQQALEKTKKIRSYIVESLTEFLSDNLKEQHNSQIVRKIVAKQVEKITGKASVDKVEITESFERKL